MNGQELFELAMKHIYGDGVPEDNDLAFKLLTQAHDMGNIEATYNLGICYHYGYGTSIDLKKAFELYLESANAGYGKGMELVGRFYNRGIYVKHDREQAEQWLNRAMESSDPDAIEEAKKELAKREEQKTIFFKADKETFCLLEELFPNDYNDRFRQFMDSSIDIYVITYLGRPIGRLVANYSNQHLDNETIPNVRVCLSHFILFRDYRKQGFGSRLLDYALNDLSSHGYTEFTVGVEDANTIAKHMYFKRGFAEKIGHGNDPCEYDLYLKR